MDGRMTAAMLSGYADKTCIGFVLARGKRGYEAFDAGEKSLEVISDDGSCRGCGECGGGMSWGDNSWREAAVEYERPSTKSLLPHNWDSMTLDALYHILNRATHERDPAPERSTVAAIIQALRERGLVALKEPATAERVSRCTDAQRAALKKTIAAMNLKQRTPATTT
jgi:hypothetical protein